MNMFLSQIKNLDLGKIGFLFLIAIFIPNFRNQINTLGAAIVNFTTFAGCIYIIATEKTLNFKSRAELKIFQVISTLFLLYLVHQSLSTVILSNTIIFRDLFEFHKPFLYLASSIVPIALIKSNSDINRFTRVLFLIFFLVALVGLIQYTRSFDSLMGLYTKNRNVASGRISTPFENPYDYGFFVSFFSYYFYGKLFFSEQKKLFNISTLLLSMLLIAMTQSRISFLAVISGLFFISTPLLLVKQKNTISHGKKPLLVAGLILASVGAAILSIYGLFYEKFRYLFGAFEVLLQGGSIKSLTMRIDQLNEVLILGSNDYLRLLFGNGISKSSYIPLESVYSFYIFRYGLVGFFILYFIPWAISVGYSLLGYKRFSKQRALFSAFFTWFAIVPFSGSGNNFMEQYRISFFYFFSMGFVVRSYYVLLNEKYIFDYLKKPFGQKRPLG